MSEIYAAFLVVVVGVILWAVASIVTDIQWVRDCKAIGAHVVEGKVYECKERP